MHLRLIYLLAVTPLVTPLVGCDSTNDVVVELAPDVISSLDGTAHVRATALSGGELMSGEAMTLTVAYKDRNGVDHPIDSVTGKTGDNGVFEGTLVGMLWDGTGTVTAEVKKDGKTVDGTATFAVIDRSPPVVTITPPAGNTIRINTQVTIPIHITDEIGVSSASCDTSGGGGGGNNGCRGGGRTTFAAGDTDVTVNFDFQANDTQVGEMITFYALAGDLSGNLGVATPIVVMIIP